MAMIKRAILSIGLFALVSVGAACTTAPSAPRFAPPSFADRPPIALDVAEVRVSSNYRPPGRAPHVDHMFPVTLERAAMGWAEDRLRAVGDDGEAAFVIEEASVIETELETQGGLRGLLRNQAAVRYDGVLRVRLVALDEEGRGALEVSVTRDQTVLESATVNERDRARHEMMRLMIDDLNAEVEAKIATYLDDFLR